VIVAIAVSAALSWLLPTWHLSFLGPVTAGARLTVFTTMWQVQAGVAAIALPILLFVVEAARDQQRAALPTGEVLIRESVALPIIAFSFLVTVRIGIDLFWFRNRTGVFVLDLVLTAATVVSALYAYQAVLRLNFSPAQMRDRSIALVEEKMRGVLLRSVKVRIGNNFLISQIRAVGISYWPFGAKRRENAEILLLRAPRDGYLSDIHVEALKQFVTRLPWRVEPDDKDPAVWLTKLYGDHLRRSDGLMRLRRSAFHMLNQELLEAQLAKVVKVGDTDEL